MPGERRGGRARTIPNRRTVLADRILTVLAGCSTASTRQRLSKLVNDPELPADIRMAVAQRAFSSHRRRAPATRRARSELGTSGGTQPRGHSRSAPQADGPRLAKAASAAARPVETMSRAALDPLFGIVCDANAPVKVRRKAAAKLATYFLPRKPVNKRWRFIGDKYDFAANAEVAREYRDIELELRDLKRNPRRDIPEIVQKIRELQVRKAAILYRLIGPCPTRYDNKEFSEDWLRLATLARKRENGIALTPEEDAEEAHRMARCGSYTEGPEQTARDYRKQLEHADRFFRKCRLFKDGIKAPRLSRRQNNDLQLLRWLYPPYDSKSRRSPEADVEGDAERWIGHPFHDEAPAEDGNFYPRPEIIEEYAHIPPYCYCYSGKPPIFSCEPPEQFYKRYNADLTLANPDAISPGT